jgi:hypothetical protein
VADGRVLAAFQGTGITSTTATNTLNTTSGATLSVSQIGTSFTITGTTVNTLYGSSLTSLTTTLTVVGRDSGARITIPLVINKI